MSRALLIALIALFTLGFPPLSHADGDDDATVVWGT
jgi:hypothetical protein